MAKLTRLYREKEAVKVVNGIGLYRLLPLESVAEYDMSILQNGSAIGTLYNNGLLDITGTGTMKNYAASGTGASPFLDSTTITELIIGNGIITIGGYAFAGCTNLTSVIIPNSVISIGGYAFAYCTSLTEIVIPDSVTHINATAFMNCTSLTEIVIPDSVIHTGRYAFAFGNPDLILKPEALEKPDGWSELWNAYDFDGTFLTVWWGGIPPQQ